MVGLILPAQNLLIICVNNSVYFSHRYQKQRISQIEGDLHNLKSTEIDDTC